MLRGQNEQKQSQRFVTHHRVSADGGAERRKLAKAQNGGVSHDDPLNALLGTVAKRTSVKGGGMGREVSCQK